MSKFLHWLLFVKKRALPGTKFLSKISKSLADEASNQRTQMFRDVQWNDVF